MLRLMDFLGNRMSFVEPPSRVVSTVPSQTELLYYLGLSKKIIGITKFCVFPQKKPGNPIKIGGTKTLHLAKIIDLRPELIIANKEENDKAQINLLSKTIPCYVSDIKTLDDCIRLIKHMGLLFNCSNKSAALIEEIQQNNKSFISQKYPIRSAIYFIWKDPLMVAGNDCFIHHMMQQFGFTNLIDQPRYPEITVDELIKMAPDVVLLSDEPFPFKEKHIEKFRQIIPKSKIVLVNGSFFSWYGSRLILTFKYGKELREKIDSYDP